MEHQRGSNNEDEASSNSLRNDLMCWEESDKEQAVTIWTRFVSMLSNAASLMCTMVQHASNRPTKLAALLVLNGCNYLETKEIPSSHQCLEALFLMLFDFFESMIYNVCHDLIDGKLLSMKRGYPGFCRLSWIFHCHMLYAGTRYPNLRKPFMIDRELKQKKTETTMATNLLQLIPTLPGMLVSCMRVMPFENPRTFLKCLEQTNTGSFFVATKSRVFVKYPFPTSDL